MKFVRIHPATRRERRFRLFQALRVLNALCTFQEESREYQYAPTREPETDKDKREERK